MKKYGITALGECLIDFLIVDADKKIHLEGNSGGAPANVLAAAAKLGVETSFIGKVGCDGFGKFLEKTLQESGICTEGLILSEKEPTTLAIVSIDSQGDRSFSFYRNKTADVMLSETEINWDLIENSKIFHFGSVSMTTSPSRDATISAVKYAKAKGCIVSYDPNLRELLWDDLARAKETMLDGMKYADVVKISDEEAEFLTGEKNLDAAIKYFLDNFQMQLLCITLGASGCLVCSRDACCEFPAYDTKCIDTTGSGDAFLGAALYWILENNIDISKLTESDLNEIARFGNAAGSLAATKKGAIPAMPALDEISECIKAVPPLDYNGPLVKTTLEEIIVNTF